LIPIFDPARDDARIEHWVERVDSLAERYRWDDDTIVRMIASRLKGNARQWYDGQTRSDATWAHIRNDFVAQFRKSVPFSKLLKEAANYETTAGQTLGDYCFQKLSKLRALQLQIPEECLVDAVIGGITDPNIARTVRSARYTDANSLYCYLNTMGEMPRNSHSSRTIEDVTHKPSTSGRDNFHQKSHEQNVTPVCYNCGMSGHFARKCRKPRRECTKCHKLGHTVDKCRVKDKHFKKPTTEVARVNAIDQTTHAVNIFMKTAYVNGSKIQCLIDSGSSHTLIRASVIKTFAIQTKQSPEIILKGFAGTGVSSNTRALLRIRIMEAVADVNVIVVSDTNLKYQMIVGRDFLDQPQIIMVKKQKALIFRSLPVLDEGSINIIDVLNTDVENNLKIHNLNFGDLKHDDKSKIAKLLNEFSDCISTSFKTLGKTQTVSLNITCNSDNPVFCHPYRLAESQKTILRDIISELLDNKIIRESRSSYASPITLVPKKPSGVRLCIDYRRLNAITVRDRYPLPLIEEQIDKLGGNKYFTALDLASGFYQVPVAKDSIHKTAFVTPEGHFEFLRMPFGLCNAPATFQRLINEVLGSLKNSIAFPYIDDIIIPSQTVEEGLSRLRQVLHKLRDHNLTLNIKKCAFFQNKIQYLGREISEEGVRPGKEKTKAILGLQTPKTVKQVRQFLGLANYFRRFVKNFSSIVVPITSLTKQDCRWSWGEPQETAFNKIKEILSKEPVLAIFNPALKTELHTDASSIGVGAILFQFVSGQQRVVAYFSKQTTVEQHHYHSYELETMAVVFALRHFRTYLLGIQFTVVTDCNALRTTFTKKDLIPRVGRWWLEVQDFHFSIEYRPGSRMAHVDSLSRNPVNLFEAELNTIDLTEADWVVAAQLEDEQLQRIRTILEAGTRTRESKQYFVEYEIRANKLFRKLEDGKTAWVVPRAARMQICRLCHDDAGHPGTENTLKRINTNYWFAGARRFVTKYVRACLHCAYYKKTDLVRQGKLHPIPKTPVPFHTIHIDHVGPFVTSSKKNKYLFVLVDAFTKFCIIEPVRNLSTKHVLKIMLNVMYLFGAPTRIISDRGTSFTSSAFKRFIETYGIKHILNAVASPRSNGQCERYNKTLLAALATTVAGKEPDTWDEAVKQIQSSLNTTHNKGINTTPTEALLGYKPKSVAEAWLLNALKVEVDRLDIPTLRSTISAHISEDQRQQKERYDRKVRDAPVYQVGDLVMVLITSEPPTGSSRKLLPKFKGPFRVSTVLLNDRYEVEDLRDGRTRQHKTVVAADHIKRWITIQDDER
jgi:transposase InsO family protein